MMDQWSNRYAHGQGGVRAERSVMGDRIKTLMLILMAVALLGVGIAGGRAISFRANTDTTLVNRMQTECDEALGMARSLSRNGGADSAAVLAKIRACVSAMAALNEVRNTLFGGAGYIVPPETFTQLYAVIDSYFNKLKNGAVITEDLTNLTNQLTTLQETLSSLR